MTTTASIEPERWAPIREAYLAGRTVIETVAVTLMSDGEVVARGKGTYFLKQASKLEPKELSSRPNPVYAHKSKASARLISGIRAAETRRPNPRIIDRWAEEACGAHGAFLAKKFSALLPPLRDMVVARTLDVDRLVRASLGTVHQLVMLGTGLDMRAFRLLDNVDMHVFELDLPHMLQERERVIGRLDVPEVRRTAVPWNLRLTPVAEALSKTEFDPTKPAIVVLEGVSMYQNDEVMRQLLQQLSELLSHPSSVAWMDLVSVRALAKGGHAEVDAFIDGMQRLGEPFTFGVEDPTAFVEAANLKATRVVSAAEFVGEGPFFDLYHFAHIRRCA